VFEFRRVSGRARAHRTRWRLPRKHTRHVELRDVTGLETPLVRRNVSRIRHDPRTHHPALVIERAQCEIGLCDAGLYQQARVLQQTPRALFIELRRVGGACQPADRSTSYDRSAPTLSNVVGTSNVVWSRWRTAPAAHRLRQILRERAERTSAPRLLQTCGGDLDARVAARSLLHELIGAPDR